MARGRIDPGDFLQHPGNLQFVAAGEVGEVWVASEYVAAIWSIWFGRMSTAATIPNTMIETYGVLYRRCSLANGRGNSLYVARE